MTMYTNHQYLDDEEDEVHIVHASSGALSSSSGSSHRKYSTSIPSTEIDERIDILETTVQEYRSQLFQMYEKLLNYEDFLYYTKNINRQYKVEVSHWNSTEQEAMIASHQSDEIASSVSKAQFNHSKLLDNFNNVQISLLDIIDSASKNLGEFTHFQNIDLTASLNRVENPMEKLREVQNDIIMPFQSLVRNTNDLKQTVEKIKSSALNSTIIERKRNSELKQQSLDGMFSKDKQRTLRESIPKDDSDDDNILNSPTYWSHFPASGKIGVDRALSRKNNAFDNCENSSVENVDYSPSHKKSKGRKQDDDDDDSDYLPETDHGEKGNDEEWIDPDDKSHRSTTSKRKRNRSNSETNRGINSTRESDSRKSPSVSSAKYNTTASNSAECIDLT